jgi:hypothetical protein
LEERGMAPSTLDYIQSRYHIAHLPLSNETSRFYVARWLVFTEVFDTYGTNEEKRNIYVNIFEELLAKGNIKPVFSSF